MDESFTDIDLFECESCHSPVCFKGYMVCLIVLQFVSVAVYIFSALVCGMREGNVFSRVSLFTSDAFPIMLMGGSTSSHCPKSWSTLRKTSQEGRVWKDQS